MFSSFFKKYVFWGGHFSKWIVTEGGSTRSPWCSEKIQGPIWRSKDHLVGTFQECQKSWILKIPLFGETEKRRPGVYFDAEYVSARSRHAKTAWIAIWSKIFVFGRKSSFSLSSPVDPLLSPYRTKLGSQGAKVAWLADWLVAWWHKVVRIETNHWSGCYSAKNWLYRQTKQQNHEKSICSQKLVFSLL